HGLAAIVGQAVGSPIGTRQGAFWSRCPDLDPAQSGVSACDAAPRTKKDQQGRKGPALTPHPSP
ncbi:MAG: hypothetical protein RLZZ141_1479, partial [Pseudomonadota bacterium]